MFPHKINRLKIDYIRKETFLICVDKNIFKLKTKQIKRKKLFVFWKIKSEFYLYKKL